MSSVPMSQRDPHLINKCQVLAALGDHEIVRILASIRPPMKKSVKREILHWNKVDKVALLKDVHDFKVTFLGKFSNSENVEDI